jgi:hypothetical protein
MALFMDGFFVALCFSSAPPMRLHGGCYFFCLIFLPLLLATPFNKAHS